MRFATIEESVADTLEACEAGALPVCRKILASPPDQFPQLNTHTGAYRMEQGYLPGRGFRWAGYLAGRLWVLYDLLGNLTIRDAARVLSLRIGEGIVRARPIDRGNCGFDAYCALSVGFEVTGDERLFAASLAAAEALEDLYHPPAGFYYQNRWLDGVLSETPACLLPILWARCYGEADGERALRHVHKTLDGGMVRPDGSCQHRLFFDPESGAIERADTVQGYSETSTWGRAQAWLVHSLVCCAEAFEDERIHEALTRAVRWYIDRLPEDGILYWDYDDPRRGEIPRDSCGTIIGAVAVRRSATLGIEPERGPAAAQRSEDEILRDYVGPGGVVLHGSWGVGEGKSRWSTLFPQQDVMPYGNYWLMEMLHRKLKPASPVFSLAARAVDEASNLGINNRP